MFEYGCMSVNVCACVCVLPLCIHYTVYKRQICELTDVLCVNNDDGGYLYNYQHPCAVRILFPFPILFIIARNEWPGSYSMPFFQLHSCFATSLFQPFSFTDALSYRLMFFICYFRFLFCLFTHSLPLSLSLSI